MSVDTTGTSPSGNFAGHGPNASLGACTGEVRHEQGAIDHLALTLQVRGVRGPFEGERAFAVRLAHLNGLARPTWVMSRAGLKAYGTVRLCSRCLSSDGSLWCACWEEPNSPWCDIHQVWLVDSCDACGRTLRWSHVGWQTCGCGRLLRSLPSAGVPPTTWEVIRSGGASAGVLLWLGAMSKFGPSAKPLKKAQRRGVAELAELLVRGAEVAAGWPVTFDELLDRHRVWPKCMGSAQLLNDAFPALLKMIGRIPDAQWVDRTKEALAAYALKSRTSNVPLLGRNELLARSRTSIARVASTLRVRSETVAGMLDAGVATEHGRRLTQSGRARRVLSEDDISALAHALNEPMGAKPASRLLGISVHRLHSLTQRGLLHPNAGAFVRSELEDLLKSVCDAARCGSPPGAALAAVEVFRRHVPVAETAAFLRALQAKEVPCYRVEEERGIALLRVCKQDLVRWSSQQDRTSSLFTIPQAAQQLREKEQVVYGLIKARLLPTSVAVIRGREARVLGQSALDEFQRKYLPLCELASRVGVQAKFAYRWARERGMECVTGPAVDGSRKYFVSRQKMS